MIVYSLFLFNYLLFVFGFKNVYLTKSLVVAVGSLKWQILTILKKIARLQNIKDLQSTKKCSFDSQVKTGQRLTELTFKFASNLNANIPLKVVTTGADKISMLVVLDHATVPADQCDMVTCWNWSAGSKMLFDSTVDVE